MLDATGHDTNCAYAADPRAKCDCGGRKPRMNIPANMGTEAPGAMPGTLERKITSIGQQLAANKESAIMMAADAAFGAGGWRREAIAASIQIDGREVYSHGGTPFMEWLAVKFESVQDGDSFKVTAVQSWKRLPEPQP